MQQLRQEREVLTRSHAHVHAGGKDTRHRKRLSEGVEGAAPGDLPGSDVNQDEVELQQELAHLKERTQAGSMRKGQAENDLRPCER